jgi:hypothetical protein
MANNKHISEKRRQVYLREIEEARGKEEKSTEESDQNYWKGYQCGIRRGFFMTLFGSAREHARWASLANDVNPVRRRLGEGYLDGLRRGTGIREMLP